MENVKYIDFFNSLSNGTRSNSIKWGYMDEDLRACTAFEKVTRYDLILLNNEKYSKQKSYTTWLKNDMIAFLYNNSSNHCIVVSAGGTLRHSLVLGSGDYSKELIKLLALIKKQFPDPEDVINKMINLF